MGSNNRGIVQLRLAYNTLRTLNQFLGATDQEYLREHKVIRESVRTSDIIYSHLDKCYQEEVAVAGVAISNLKHDSECLIRERNTLKNILDNIRNMYPAIFEDRKE